MKVFVTGTNGQLGYDVIKRLEAENIEFMGSDKDTLDITNEEQVRNVLLEYKPNVVVHCAAYTAVDKAEDDKETCYNVNVLGTKYIAETCKELGAKMVYISTDYVFDGEGEKPFEITDIPNPINYYGQTKYEGELEVQKALEKLFIVRISWVFGSNGNNFIKTMIRLGSERNELNVVADQIGSPTYTFDLAKVLLNMIKTEEYGIYHITNEGFCSWYDFAVEIFKQAGMDVKVNAITTNQFPTKAKRPKNSRLSKRIDNKIIITEMPKWQYSIKRFLND